MWLTKLPGHSIFTLPVPEARPPLSTHPSLSELPRPASPNLSAAIPRSTSLNSLASISTLGGGGAKSKKNHSSSSFSNGKRETGGIGKKSRIALVRGTELVVAVGSELRISNLVDVKARSDEVDQKESYTPISDEFEDVSLGEYKTLHTPEITFEIQQLVLNATSNLLAVVGRHSVAVLVIPRKGWSTSVGRTLQCRSLLVGKFYHCLPASPSVAQVTWHPWGDNSSSLLVLTSDSILREYTISNDAEEPSQTISFTKNAEEGRERRRDRSTSFFSSDDLDAEEAVAFCFGEGAGWGPLTLFGLMKNGDIVALCPFLPKKAAVPASYIHSLSNHVSSQFQTLADSMDVEPSSTSLTLRSSSFGIPSKSFSLSTMSDRTITSSATRETVELQCNLQIKYANSLVRQAATSSRDSAQSSADDDEDRLVSITPPPWAARVARQGPYLLQPAPIDFEIGAELNACDIVYLRSSNARGGVEGDVATTDGVGLLAVAYNDGRVDLCIEIEKAQAKWETSDEGEDENQGTDPTLVVYETINLGLAVALPDSSNDVASALRTNVPSFVKDPLYPDTLYVHHSLGAHCLLLSQWLDVVSDIISSSDEDPDLLSKEAEHALRAQPRTDVLWILKTVTVDEDESTATAPPVVGLVVVNDVFLGYSLLLVTAALQLVGIELSLRVDSSLLPSTTDFHPAARGLSSEPPAYLSLLDSPFEVSPLLTKRGGISGVPRLAIKLPAGTSSKEVVVTPDTLRFMGKTVETFRHEIRDLVTAADAVQCRLELQTKELARQLSKLEELSNLSSTLRSSTTGREGLAGRLERVSQTQAQLLARTDRVLQRLMEAHQPLLSTYEKKWFEELGRTAREVTAESGGDHSLERRTERVVAQLQNLRPALEELKQKERLAASVNGNGVKKNGQKNGIADSPHGMGRGQLAKLEHQLGEESRMILEARDKLDKLISVLAASSLS